MMREDKALALTITQIGGLTSILPVAYGTWLQRPHCFHSYVPFSHTVVWRVGMMHVHDGADLSTQHVGASQ